MYSWRKLTHSALYQAVHPYIRIMRLDKPIGTLLVWFPCMWTIFLAAKQTHVAWFMIPVFTLGAILTRSAGCIINDLQDKDIDPLVKRTQNRPLANGDMPLHQAKRLAGILLLIAATLFYFLPLNAIILGAISIIPMALYPQMKHYTFWPQLFLGITINWGIWVAWAACGGKFDLGHILPVATLYGGCIFWTLGYDTIYAHQDREDDQKIGVKSTALLLGNATYEYVAWFYKGALVMITISGIMTSVHIMFYVFMAAAALLVTRNVQDIDLDDPASCAEHFQLQALFGLLVTAAFVAGRLLG